MATEMQRLVVSLEARVAQFDKALAKANGAANKRARAIESRFATMNSKVTGYLSSFGKGLVGGIAAGGIAGIVSQVGQVAKGVAAVGQEAKRAGVSAQAFQELGYVAQQSGVGVDALIDGLKELNLRADEFIVTGKGPAAEAFARLGYSADELKVKLKDPSALFTEIIGKLGQLETAAQIRIADEIFGGTGGEQLVRFIEQGEDGIRRTIGEAHKLGAVLSDDVIEKAAELDKKFQQVTTTVGNALKTAIVEAASALTGFIEEFNRLEQNRMEAQRASDAGAYIGGLVKPQGDALTFGKSDRPTSLDARMAGTLVTELSETDQRLVDALRKRYSEAVKTAAGVPSTGGGGSRENGFDPDPEAFGNMLGYTEDYVDTQREANARLEEFGSIAQSAGASLANALSDGKLEGEELLSIIGQISSLLLQMGNLGGSGIGGNFLSGLLGGIGGFADGGYTGDGPRNKVAGFAHKGEVIFSQNDVRRHGGVGAVEAMRKGMPGYANGGPVGVPSVASPGAAASRPQAVHVTVGVSADNNGNLMPFVESVSQRSAASVVQAAAPSIVKTSVGAVQQTMRNRPGYTR